MSAALTVLSAAAQDILGQTGSMVPVCRDSDDDLMLACARDAVADHVVTGDEDLWVLKNYEGISIPNPGVFEKLFPDGQGGHVHQLASVFWISRAKRKCSHLAEYS